LPTEPWKFTAHYLAARLDPWELPAQHRLYVGDNTVGKAVTFSGDLSKEIAIKMLRILADQLEGLDAE